MTTSVGADVASLEVLSDYWRPSMRSLDAKLCTHADMYRVCIGGRTANVAYDLADSAGGCANLTRGGASTNGLHGPLCSICPHRSYFDTLRGACVSCRDAITLGVTALGTALAIALVATLVSARHARLSTNPRATRLKTASLEAHLSHDAAAPSLSPLVAPPPRLSAADSEQGRPALAPAPDPAPGPFRWLVGTLQAALGGSATWRWLSARAAHLSEAAHNVTLSTKLHICLHFWLIEAQISSVYQVVYPAGYASIDSELFKPLRIDFFSWIPGMHLSCVVDTLASRLLLLTFAPLAFALVALVASVARHRSMLPALPFVLWWLFFVYPTVASQGFQALGRCECFEDLDGRHDCFLPADLSVPCSWNGAHGLAGGGVRQAAWLAVLVYAVAVPLGAGVSLYCARDAIRRGEPTELSRALSFLHGAFLVDFFWWQLVDVARALVLTGFLALVRPGSLFQLYSGLTVALGFQILNVWVGPYTQPGSSFLSMITSSGLVLIFLASLQVQTAAKSSADSGFARDSFVASVVLFGATFSAFAMTVLIFLRGVATVSRLPRFRWERTAAPVEAPELLANSYHVLILCSPLGCEQAEALQTELSSLLPGLRCRVSSTEGPQTDRQTARRPRSQGAPGVLVLLTGFRTADGTEHSDTLAAEAVVSELEGVTRAGGAPVIAMWDPEYTSVRAHLNACPEHLRWALAEPVALHRHRALRDVSLCLAVRRLLDASDGIGLARGQEQMQLRPPVGGKLFHLFVSSHDPTALAAVERMAAKVRSWPDGSLLCWTDRAAERPNAEAFLVSIDAGSSALEPLFAPWPRVEEISSALLDGTRMIVAQAIGTARLVPFESVRERTPAEIRSMYSSPLVPLCQRGDSHQHASTLLLLHALGARPARATQNPLRAACHAVSTAARALSQLVPRVSRHCQRAHRPLARCDSTAEPNGELDSHGPHEAFSQVARPLGASPGTPTRMPANAAAPRVTSPRVQ